MQSPAAAAGGTSGTSSTAPVGAAPPAPAVEAVPQLTVRAGGDVLDLLELGRLLQALADTSRIGLAARARGISYRNAWGRLVDAERVLGVPLVERVKGHGTRLSASGADLVRALELFERAGQRQLDAPLQVLRAALDRLTGAPEPPLRIAASHDLLLQEIVTRESEAGAAARTPRWSARFIGSADAVAALMAGQADLAGFHLPDPLSPLADRPPVFRTPGYFVEPVVRREQGLITARGNPKRIRDVVDLARPGVRFVNRQRGAGTRTWFDRLLRERGLSPSGIRGYEHEEFTHYAVAASVAAGLADAGFGLRAAASQLGLGFVSIGMECYYLCGEQRWSAHPRVRALVHELHRLAAHTPGYVRCRPMNRPAH